MPEPSLRLAVALNGYGLEHHELDGGRRDILPWADLRALGQLAESLRYERVYLPEIGGREAFSTLAGLGAATDRIGLATGVLRLGRRDLVTMAMGASSLDEMTGGRLVLGVGSAEPIERTMRHLDALRALLRGGDPPASEAGGAAVGPLDWYRAPRDVPVHLAALGPRMVSLAGEIADGVILNWCTPERVAEARAAIPRREGFTIAVYVRACLSHVDEHAVEALKTAAARYVALEPYARQFEAMGLGKELGEAREGLSGNGPPKDVISDRLVERTCVWGGREQALGRLEQFRDAGADVVVVYPVPAGEAVSSLSGTLMAAAPDPALEH